MKKNKDRVAKEIMIGGKYVANQRPAKGVMRGSRTHNFIGFLVEMRRGQPARLVYACDYFPSDVSVPLADQNTNVWF